LEPSLASLTDGQRSCGSDMSFEDWIGASIHRVAFGYGGRHDRY
jgi:hypothetical protein